MPDNVFRYTPIKRLYNLDITPIYAKYQLNKNIIFINGSVTQLPFKDNTFDFVTSISLLHPLIGSSRKKSEENACIAISEMIRVVKDGGYIIVCEMFIKYKLFSTILFYILRFLSKIGIRSNYFGLHKDVVICVLTPSEIKDLLVNNNSTVELAFENYIRGHTQLRWKLTILMSNAGTAYLIGKINRKRWKHENIGDCEMDGEFP